MIFLLSFLISIVGILLGVAFFTLMERKVMGLMHYRKGPNKVIILGVSQPISDAVKLLSKEFLKFPFSKNFMFVAGPLVGMALMLLCWQWYKYSFQSLSKSGNSLFLIFSLMGLSSYTFILTGWGSNTKYTLMGSYRAIAQIISYEVCLILFILVIIYLSGSYKPSLLMMMQQNFWFSAMCVPLFLTWILLCMAESNRTPFDHAESESELVSGFNVEYGGGLFAMIFIAEYGMIMFLSFLTSLIFLGAQNILVKTMLMCFLFVWVRCSFPRVRYDKLMSTSWKLCLPYSLCLLCIMVSVYQSFSKFKNFY